MSSRIKNVSRNAFIGVLMQVISLIFTFVVRTAFVYILSKEYLGVNGLFTSVLSYLSLAELGVGTAITVFLYKPLLEKDIEKVKSLMRFYRTCYCIIGTIVFVVGMAILPAIPYMINGDLPEELNIYIVYILFLLNSSITYFFSYRTALIEADQKRYIVDIIIQVFTILKDIALLLILLLNKNYYGYLIGQIISTALMYIFIYAVSNKMYPYLRDKDVLKLSKEEKLAIYKNVGSLMIYKIAGIVLSSSDNIIISTMIGIVEVGLLSNYTLIVNAIKNISNKLVHSFAPSVANYKESGKSVSDQTDLFKCIFLLVSVFYAFISICIAIFFNEVITLWLGEGYIFDRKIVLVIVFYFYLEGVGTLLYDYRTVYKLFNENKFIPVVAALINIILSIILALYLGVFGVLLATPIARLCTYSIMDPYLLYRKAFNRSPLSFYVKYVVAIVYMILCYVIMVILCNLIPNTNIWMLILNMIICVVGLSVLFLLYVLPQKEFRHILGMLKRRKR